MLWQIPIMFIALIAVQIAVFLVIQTEPVSDQGGLDDISKEVSAFTAIALLGGVVLFVPFFEEVVFRGIVYGGFRRKFGVSLSVVFSAMIFAGAHVVPIAIPYYVTMGISLALLYEFHKTLWAPFIAHALINAVASVLVINTVFS